MHFIQEIITSTTFVVGIVAFLSLALAITSFKLLIVTAERREAKLLAKERTEQAREANHQLQQTLGSIHAQVWFLDTQTRVVGFNGFTQEFLGVEPLQARGRPMMALLPQWVDPEEAQTRNEQVVFTGQEILGTIESYECEGEIRWVTVDRLPSFDAQGDLDGMRVFLYDITDLKDIEKDLLLQKSILEAQSETSLDAIIVFAPDHRCLLSNQRFHELWDLPMEVMHEGNGERTYKHIDTQLAEQGVLHQWLTTFQETPTKRASDLFRLQDGRILDWYSAPIIGNDSHHYGRVWYFRDVTETLKTEQALRESEVRNRALVNSIPDLLFRIRSDGTFIDYKGAKDYTPAVIPERFLGHHVTDVFDSATAQQLMEKLQSALHSQEIQIHEYEMPMLNGEMRNWEQRIVASGEDEILVIVRDISSRKQAEDSLRNAHDKLEQRVHERTMALRKMNAQLQQEVEERYRAEEALRKSEERLEMALLGADLGLVDIDLQTGKAVYNERWAEIRGYPLDRHFDTMATWKDSIHPDDRLTVTDALENHLQGETPFFEQEYRVRHSNETWRWVRCRGKIVNRSQQGTPLRFAGTQTDITEYKQLEQQLLQAQKMDAVGRLAGGVAHDFNNILTVIMSYSELVLLQVDGDNRLQARVEEIKKAADKATRLTRQLLMFSRGETVAPRSLDMNRLILDIESMLERLIGEHINLNIHLDPTINAIKGDAGQLEQVLLNLVVNGRDAMPEGGALDVTTRRVHFYHRQSLPHPELRPGIYTELSITDTGCGMSPDTQKRIFEPFFTTKGPGKGTGLGLSTVFGIIKQNRGFIDVTSEVGEGTTFRLLFPAIGKVAHGHQTFALPAIEQKLGEETILLVEDETQIRDIIGSALEDAGYTLLSAADGQEALTISVEHSGAIDLMITDVVMPTMSGVKLAEQMQLQRPSTKLLFVSGYTDGEINMNETMDGNQAFLRKPFTPAILTGIVRKLLDNEPLSLDRHEQ